MAPQIAPCDECGGMFLATKLPWVGESRLCVHCRKPAQGEKRCERAPGHEGCSDKNCPGYRPARVVGRKMVR